MLCQDTGQIEAIHIPIKLEVVKKISSMAQGIEEHGGDGEIKLLYRNGVLSTIEFMIRQFFGHKKQTIN